MFFTCEIEAEDTFVPHLAVGLAMEMLIFKYFVTSDFRETNKFKGVSCDAQMCKVSNLSSLFCYILEDGIFL